MLHLVHANISPSSPLSYSNPLSSRDVHDASLTCGRTLSFVWCQTVSRLIEIVHGPGHLLRYNTMTTMVHIIHVYDCTFSFDITCLYGGEVPTPSGAPRSHFVLMSCPYLPGVTWIISLLTASPRWNQLVHVTLMHSLAWGLSCIHLYSTWRWASNAFRSPRTRSSPRLSTRSERSPHC